MKMMIIALAIAFALASPAAAQTSGCIAQSGNCAPPPPCGAFDQEPRCVAGRVADNEKRERERAIDALLERERSQSQAQTAR